MVHKRKRISKAEQKKVYKETESYLQKFLSLLTRENVINIYALYKYICDKNVSYVKKVVPFGALLYFIIPTDAVPDFIPIVGLSDDIGVIAAAVIYLKQSLNEYIKIAEAELIERGWVKSAAGTRQSKKSA